MPSRTKRAETVVAAKPAAKPASQPTTYQVASAESRPVELKIAAADSLLATSSAASDYASANDVISTRGFWQGLPESQPPQRASTAAKTIVPLRRAATGAAEPVATGSLTPWPMPGHEPTDGALSYAPTTAPSLERHPAATSAGPVTRAVATAHADTTVAVKRNGNAAAAPRPAGVKGLKSGPRLNDPWMRAMIVAPSAGSFMSTSLLGAPDYRGLEPQMWKPASAVMMTFSNDPYLGMTTDRFTGTAVVFVATITFAPQSMAQR
jgi:hypothetical protein